MAIDLLEELQWRGLVHQSTNEARLGAHLAHTRRIYAGFDPTADSLTIGNLMPIMMLVHAARAGHVPIVVMGGGTGLIGDPSGKSAERQLLSEEQVRQNVERCAGIFRRVFTNAGLEPPKVLNNLDWLGGLKYIEVLRDVGKHFSVNEMIARESVRVRLEEREHGISYTEFSYMILQAYDFLHLHQHESVTVQMGGSDQWGNIVAGIGLVKAYQHAQMEAQALAGEGYSSREEAMEEHGGTWGFSGSADHISGLTCPLVTKSDGGKFGKTESGAVWLTAPDEGGESPARTSAYAMHQFWLNTSDDDVVKFLRYFTLLAKQETDELEHDLQRGVTREAQRVLADAATALVHGHAASEEAKVAGRALFPAADEDPIDIAELSPAAQEMIAREAPCSEHDIGALSGDGASLVDVLVQTGLAPSKRQARQFLQNGAVAVNGKSATLDTHLTNGDLLPGGRYILLRRGKKNWHLTRWSDAAARSRPTAP